MEEYIEKMRKGNLFIVILSQTNSLPTIEVYLYEKEWIEEEEHRLLSLYWKNFKGTIILMDTINSSVNQNLDLIANF